MNDAGVPLDPDSDGDDGRRVQRFPWPEAGEQLEAFAARFPAARGSADGRAFVAAAAPAARLVLPLLLPPVLAAESPQQYAARLPVRLGRTCVLLLQAGAMALGYWDEGELLAHKASKRYVVRGTGRAQPLHLKTRGKSRYGSRLRLQNWRRLLGETNARLRLWWDEFGAPEQTFAAVPVRTLPELFASEPPPPLPRSALRRIPLHVHVPDFEELQRVWHRLAHGLVELPPLA